MSLEDQTEKEIKDEKERARDLDTKLREWERKIRNKRREIGGSNAGANFSTQSKKQEKTFENRLDHVSEVFVFGGKFSQTGWFFNEFLFSSRC